MRHPSQLSLPLFRVEPYLSSPILETRLSPPEPVTLHRIEPGRNMARFYRLAVERDLFGSVVLVRQWGRLGTAGRTRLEEHQEEGAAALAMARLEASKRSRRYVALRQRAAKRPKSQP